MKLPVKSLVYLILSICVVLLFLFIIIIPQARSLEEMEIKIKEYAEIISDQNHLIPLYIKVKKKALHEYPEDIPIIDNGYVPSSEAEEFNSLRRAISEGGHYIVTGISPDISSMKDDPQSMVVNILAKGEYSRLKEMLARTILLPFVLHLEQMKVTPLEGVIEISLKIRLKRQKDV